MLSGAETEKIASVLSQSNVRRAAVFGSVARGAAGVDSDLDLLVELGPDLSLLGFVGLKHRLEEAVGRRVDLVEYGTIKPRMRQNILRDQVVIFHDERLSGLS